MGKIFKHMKPYWMSIVIVIALLFVQAWCDLALPSYTSDIIDVGILKSGVEHVLPEAVTAEEFETAEFIMTDREMEVWEGSYEEVGDVYSLLVTDQALLDSLRAVNYELSDERYGRAGCEGTDRSTDRYRCEDTGEHERGGPRADARCGT